MERDGGCQAGKGGNTISCSRGSRVGSAYIASFSCSISRSFSTAFFQVNSVPSTLRLLTIPHSEFPTLRPLSTPRER